MGIVISLDTDLINLAKTHAVLEHRSVPKQIEYWAKIGRIAEENPELSYEAIRGILLGMHDMKFGNVEEYTDDML